MLPSLAIDGQALAIEHHTEKLSVARGVPWAVEIYTQAAAKAHTSLQVGARLPLPPERRHDVENARRVGARGCRDVDHNRLAGTSEIALGAPGIRRIERRREIVPEPRSRDRTVRHAVMLGVVEMVPRRSVLIDRHPVQRRAEDVALAREADQVVRGIVEPDRALFFFFKQKTAYEMR